jgi:hypothetical protein
MVDPMQHYIILSSGTLVPVNETVWKLWTDANMDRLRLRETHLYEAGKRKPWGKVLTLFTGVDACPGMIDPYLWETVLLDCDNYPDYPDVRHCSEQSAVDAHGQYVHDIVWMMRRKGVELSAVIIRSKK